MSHIRNRNISIIYSSIEEISYDIAQTFLLRPFPGNKSIDGLLEYDSYQPQDQTKLQRPIHGYTNACRVAILMRNFYYHFLLAYKFLYPSDVQQQIEAITPDRMKKLMVVGLLRSIGRTQDGDSGLKFATQGKVECDAYLLKIGLSNQQEREGLSSLIPASDGVGDQKCTIEVALLADACLLETFRDGVSYDIKAIQLTNFFCVSMMTGYLSNTLALQPILRLIQICSNHARVIQRHQKFITSSIQKHNQLPIDCSWPLSDNGDYSGQTMSHRIDLENSLFCFSKCKQDIEWSFYTSSSNPTHNLIEYHIFLNYCFNYLDSLQINLNSENNISMFGYLLHFMNVWQDEWLIDSKNGLYFKFTVEVMEKLLQDHYKDIYTGYIDSIKSRLTLVNDSQHSAFYYVTQDEKTAKQCQQWLRWISLWNKDDTWNETVLSVTTNGQNTFFKIKLTAFQIQMVKAEHAKAIEEVITFGSPEIQYSTPKHIFFKTIRDDANCFIDSFVDGITATHKKPDQPELRKGPHKKFTASITGVVKYDDKKTKHKQSNASRETKTYSVTQPVSFATQGFYPKHFSHQSDGYDAGMIFDAEKSIIRAAYLHNVRSIDRPYESYSKKKCQNFYEKHYANKSYINLNQSDSISQINVGEYIKLADTQKTNEWAVKLKLTPNSTAIAVFSLADEAFWKAMYYMYTTLKKSNPIKSQYGFVFNEEHTLPYIYYTPNDPNSHLKNVTAQQKKHHQEQANNTFQNPKDWVESIKNGSFRFLFGISNYSRGFELKYNRKPIVFILFEGGLFFVVDYLFERSEIAGTLHQYLEYQFKWARLSGYETNYISEKMVFHASKQGRLDLLKLFITHSTKNLASSMHGGQSCLFAATYNSHPDVVEYLIAKGADANAQSTLAEQYEKYGKTALYWAVKHDHYRITEILLKGGAQDEWSKKNQNTLILATKNGNLPIIKLLTQYLGATIYTEPTPPNTLIKNAFYYAHRINRVDIIKYVFDNGLKPSKHALDTLFRKVDEDKNTILIRAINRTNYDDLVCFLCAADPRQILTKNAEQKNAISILSTEHPISFLWWMLDGLATLTNLDKEEKTALLNKLIFDSAFSKDENTLTKILNHKLISDDDKMILLSDVIKSDSISSAGVINAIIASTWKQKKLNSGSLHLLHLAISKNSLNYVKIIDAFFPNDYFSEDEEKRTPLFLAVSTEKSLDLISYLLNKASVYYLIDQPLIDQPDQEQITPLIASIQNKSWQITRLLLDKGANVNIRANCGTALSLILNVLDESTYDLASKIIAVDASTDLSHHFRYELQSYDLSNHKKSKLHLVLEKSTRISEFFHRAARNQDYELVRLFLKHLNPNLIHEKNTDGDTIVHFAALHSDHELFNRLLDFNPNLSLKNNKNFSPVDIMIETDQPEMLKALLEMDSILITKELYQSAADSGNHHFLKKLWLKKPTYEYSDWMRKQKINLSFMHGETTPLHTAVTFGNKTLVRDWIVLGADISVKNEHNQCPQDIGLKIEIDVFSYVKKISDELKSTPTHSLFYSSIKKKHDAACAFEKFILNKTDSAPLSGYESQLLKGTLGKIMQSILKNPQCGYYKWLPDSIKNKQNSSSFNY